MISIGYIIGTSLAAILILAALFAATRFMAFRKRELATGSDYSDAGPALGFTIGSIAAAIVIATGWVFSTFPPFDMDYHRYDAVAGTVESVEKRLVADGKGMSEKYVVLFEGDDQQYGCLDTRCAPIKVGEQAELSCIRVWAWYGSDGYDCEYVTAGGRS